MGIGRSQNVEVEIKGNTLVIKVDLRREIGLSRSGKNVLVGTTAGQIRLENYGKPGYYVGLNVFKQGGKKNPTFKEDHMEKPSNKPRVRRITK